MPSIFIQLIITVFSGLFGTNLDNQSTKNYAVYRVTQPSQVRLIENFEGKKDTEVLVKENECEAGINGGFYTEDNKPLGWFMSGEEEIQIAKSSDLFNGFVWLGKSDDLKISRQKPTGDVNWGFQSGPLLMEGGVVQKLKMETDKPARRMVIGRDNSGNVYFLAILDNPMLADLPKIVADISKRKKLRIATAINLDSGNASAFFGPEKTITENVAVGSWLCVKK